MFSVGDIVQFFVPDSPYWSENGRILRITNVEGLYFYDRSNNNHHHCGQLSEIGINYIKVG